MNLSARQTRSLESLLADFRDPHKRGLLKPTELERLATNRSNLELSADEFSILQTMRGVAFRSVSVKGTREVVQE